MWIFGRCLPLNFCFSALVRNSQLPKSSKPTEMEEASIILIMCLLFTSWIFNFYFWQVKNIVTATKVGFDHLSLDYTFQVQHHFYTNLLYTYRNLSLRNALDGWVRDIMYKLTCPCLVDLTMIWTRKWCTFLDQCFAIKEKIWNLRCGKSPECSLSG